jgi:Raf kinase inhibitor-like YbhB/YbcL family protein
MSFGSPAFKDGGKIPSEYTCDGINVSPPLTISGVPSKARSLAIVMDDPDAGGFTHWIVYNINPSVESVGKGVLPSGGINGLTSFGEVAYGGPCPPVGQHQYSFRLFALDADLAFASPPKKGDVSGEIRKHLIAEAKFTGTYQRK